MSSAAAWRYALACAAIGVTAACASSSDTSGTAQVSASADRPRAEICGDVDRIEQAISGFGVADVSIVGQCTTVAIRTALPDDSSGAETARRICTAAATVAYSGEVTGISVTGVDGSELAVGIDGAPCIGD
ncbi:hypothetical protein [Nocardia noduli]|uniref:hypothetical protein n=1 Tax=Nocardia noduli TaxID=2815722 RepID=UPI001C2121AF|nr:hypothetical protein [Nocardia noduli]